MLEANGRDFGKPKEFRGEDAPMASDEVFSPSMRMGTLNPKLSMLLAI